MGNKIYLASPFFNPMERANVLKACEQLRDNGFYVFCPLEHKIPNGEKMSNTEWGRAVYEFDVENIDNCDTLVCLYYGLYSDSGTAFEVGYAVAKRKRVIIVDFTEDKASLMIYGKNEICSPKDLETFFAHNDRYFYYKKYPKEVK